jgi:predicted metal-dependent hydrolase
MTFVLETLTWAAISLVLDPDARRQPWEVLKGVWRLRRSPFASPAAVRQLFEYHRVGFHPNDRDTTELIASWRARLFEPPAGELTSLRAS